MSSYSTNDILEKLGIDDEKLLKILEKSGIKLPEEKDELCQIDKTIVLKNSNYRNYNKFDLCYSYGDTYLRISMLNFSSFYHEMQQLNIINKNKYVIVNEQIKYISEKLCEYFNDIWPLLALILKYDNTDENFLTRSDCCYNGQRSVSKSNFFKKQHTLITNTGCIEFNQSAIKYDDVIEFILRPNFKFIKRVGQSTQAMDKDEKKKQKIINDDFPKIVKLLENEELMEKFGKIYQLKKKLITYY